MSFKLSVIICTTLLFQICSAEVSNSSISVLQNLLVNLPISSTTPVPLPKTEEINETSTITTELPALQHIETSDPLPKGSPGLISRFMSLSFRELPVIKVFESDQPNVEFNTTKSTNEKELLIERNEEKRIGGLHYEPYKLLISKIGLRGNWSSHFTCGFPGFIESVIYYMRNDKVTGLNLQCKNPKNKHPLLLPDSLSAGNRVYPSNTSIFDLSCSHWDALEVIGLNFVYDENNELLNVGRRCRGTEPRIWAIGTATRSKGAWDKGFTCPDGSRIWGGQIKEGIDPGNGNDSYVNGLMISCYIQKSDYDMERIIETFDTGITDGDWSEWKLCSKYSYGHSIRLRYGSFVRNYGPSKKFASAKRISRYLNAIEIGCIEPGNSTIQWLEIENKEESPNGTWMKEHVCDGLINDVNLQVRKTVNESFGDDWEVFDKISGIGLSSVCSSERGWLGDYMNEDIGTWLAKTSRNKCPENFAACGVRYRNTDDLRASKIGISKVQFRCCPVLFPNQCTPIQEWVLLTTMENNGTIQTFHYDTKWENGLFFTKLINFIELKFRLYLHDGMNNDSWINEPYDTFTPYGKSYTQPYSGESETKTSVYQLVGQCEEMLHIKVKSTQLKFITLDKNGNYLYTEYN